MIKISFIAEQHPSGAVSFRFVDESDAPSQDEVLSLKTQLEKGGFSNVVEMCALAEKIVKDHLATPSTRNFQGSPARTFVASPAGARMSSKKRI